VFNFDLNDKEYRETIYITNKQGENFFLNKDDPTKKVPLPGYTTVNDICLMTTDKPLSEQDTEAKMVNVWDNDAKKEVPKSVPVLTELLGQKVTLGILKQLVNKNEKNQSSGKYEPTAETREENVIEKVFHSPTHMTVVEAQNGATEARTVRLGLQAVRIQAPRPAVRQLRRRACSTRAKLYRVAPISQGWGPPCSKSACQFVFRSPIRNGSLSI
jgi:hypothetical protein